MEKFNSFKSNSKVWIYGCINALTEKQILFINEKLALFTKSWNAHGSLLTAEYSILYKQFIVFVIDEDFAKASGCSIDSSVKVIKDIMHELQIDLLDRSQVFYTDSNKISSVHYNKIDDLVATHVMNKNTMVFDNSITTLAQLKNDWPITAQKTWLLKHFNN